MSKEKNIYDGVPIGTPTHLTSVSTGDVEKLLITARNALHIQVPGAWRKDENLWKDFLAELARRGHLDNLTTRTWQRPIALLSAILRTAHGLAWLYLEDRRGLPDFVLEVFTLNVSSNKDTMRPALIPQRITDEYRNEAVQIFVALGVAKEDAEKALPDPFDR